MTSQLKRTSLALAKTNRIAQCNKQHWMNVLVEIVVAEVAGLQLCRLKIRISCRKEFSAVYFWPENCELMFVCNQSPADLSNWRISSIYTLQRWKPVGSTGTGRVDRPVGLPVGSRFFDRQVKSVEKPVEFSFLATKRHLSTNRNILIYFLIAKTFDQKTVLTNHIFWKHLLNGFKLWLICCDH